MTDNNAPKACVFISAAFSHDFPNLDHYFRKGISDDDMIMLDCASVLVQGPFLELVALPQKLPHISDTIRLWVPLSDIRAVLFDSQDKILMGFSFQPLEDNDQH